MAQRLTIVIEGDLDQSADELKAALDSGTLSISELLDYAIDERIDIVLDVVEV